MNSHAPHTKGGDSQAPARTVTAQQKKFDRFRYVFNHERAHEALANETPGNIYVPSTLLLPSKVASLVYPRSFQTRRVNNSAECQSNLAEWVAGLERDPGDSASDSRRQRALRSTSGMAILSGVSSRGSRRAMQTIRLVRYASCRH
jgi:hypothetical protein